MSGDLLLIPNLGAEERPGAAPPRAPAARAMAGLWRLLFGPHTLLAGEPERARAWPESLGREPEGPVFARLDAPGAATAWLNDEAAAREAARADRALTGAPPEVVRSVHDKAFALETARAEGLEPPSLRGLPSVLEPELLRDPARALPEIEARLARWPDWTRGAFTLKPRLGSSGRGRVPGRAGRVDTPELRGALPRLAARGGALLEPWLARSGDYSSQLWIDPDGGIVLLGTLEPLVSPSGVYRGHRGTIDPRGRVGSGCAWDAELREAAAAVARAAAARGFHGPCGVDAFRYAGAEGRPELRAVVEFNARFTTGTVVIGLVRRALRRARARLGLRGGVLAPFAFALEPPAGGWREPEARDALLFPLDPERGRAGPALLVARGDEQLEAAFTP